MKRRRFTRALLLAGLLTGCGNSDSYERSTSPEMVHLTNTIPFGSAPSTTEPPFESTSTTTTTVITDPTTPPTLTSEVPTTTAVPAYDPLGAAEADQGAVRVSPRTVPDVIFGYTDNVGIKSMMIDGVEFADGCGFGFIGSITGTDDFNNLSTCNTDGPYMKPLNNGPARVPQSLTFTPISKGEIAFRGTVGPAPFAIASLSVPMDMNKGMCTHFRFQDESAWRDYAHNPPAYEMYLGTVGIYAQEGVASMEMLCGRYIITLALNTDAPNTVVFGAAVDHPAVNNLEFSFLDLPKGAVDTIGGTIRVSYAGQDDL